MFISYSISFSPLVSENMWFCKVFWYYCYVSWQELGLYKAQTRLPFNAFGTMAMAREVRTWFLNSCVCYLVIRISWKINWKLPFYFFKSYFLTGVWEQLSFKPSILATKRKWAYSQQCKYIGWSICCLWLYYGKWGLFSRSQGWWCHRIHSSGFWPR